MNALGLTIPQSVLVPEDQSSNGARALLWVPEILAGDRAEGGAEQGEAHRALEREVVLVHGQSFELTAAVEPGPFDGPAIARLDEAFAREHERTYGHRAGRQEPVELIALRLVARGVPDLLRVPDRVRHDDRRGAGGSDAVPPRRAYLGHDRGWLVTPVVRRAEFGTGLAGPLIVEVYDATGVVPPGWRAALDDAGHILMTLRS